MAQRQDALHTLGFAVWSDDIALVRELLDAGTPVDDYGTDDTAGKTPLMESVDEIEPFYDSTRVLLTRLLLSAGADVDRPDNSGRTALHYAVGAGRAAVELLLAAGADPNAAREGGLAPLHEAILRGNASAIEALCRAGRYESRAPGKDRPYPIRPLDREPRRLHPCGTECRDPATYIRIERARQSNPLDQR